MARTLKPEDRISHYRVVGPLGAGGMGEVYRARDQNLPRDVALKILPPELVLSEERVRRFTLEAESASSLNHPHIVTIYEIGEDRVQGAEPDSSPLHYISMELVSGKTLAAKIHEEKADLKTLLGWLAQAAEGVAKAHAAGIVHRDLKPGNIMVSSDGYAKVLDFGLAKLTERQASDPGFSAAATVTAGEHTSEGTALGTVDYMAPEQVRGQVVDARVDVFSFGVILYEAATCRRPFSADSKVETQHRILHDVPAPIEEVNPEVPAELRRLIRRCLAKDPNQRLDSMRTLALELREIVEEYDALSGSASSGRAPAAVGQLKRRFAGARIVAVVVLAIASVFAFLPRGPARLNPDMHTRTVNVPMSGIRYPGLSQDGRWIALPARDDRGVWGLYYMNATGGEVRPIAVDTAVSVNYADISPDGSQIAFAAETRRGSEIRLVRTLGGPVHTVARFGGSPHWAADGRRIGYMVYSSAPSSGRYEFWSVRPDGSDRERLGVDSLNTPDQGGRSSFAWSPDGKQLAWLRNFAASTYNEIIVHDLVSGHERQLTHDRKFIDELVWTRQNEILFSSDRGGVSNLWIMRSSGGRPVQVTRGRGPDVGIRVSADGRTALYLVQDQLASIGWWDVVTGQGGLVTRQDERFGRIRPSPDGRQIAVGTLGPDALSLTPTLTVMARDGGNRRTLAAAEQNPRVWSWSPDGTRVVWAADRGSRPDSLDLHIVDVATGETLPAFAVASRGNTAWLSWMQTDTLRIADGHGTFDYCLSAGRSFNRSPDSTFYMTVRVPGWVVLFDTRATPPGMYVRPAEGGPERLVMPAAWFPVAWPVNERFGYCCPDSLGLCRMQFPSGLLEPMAHVFPEGRRNMTFYSSPDGRVIYWRQERESAKLVLIENLHR